MTSGAKVEITHWNYTALPGPTLASHHGVLRDFAPWCLLAAVTSFTLHRNSGALTDECSLHVTNHSSDCGRYKRPTLYGIYILYFTFWHLLDIIWPVNSQTTILVTATELASTYRAPEDDLCVSGFNKVRGIGVSNSGKEPVWQFWGQWLSSLGQSGWTWKALLFYS